MIRDLKWLAQRPDVVEDVQKWADSPITRLVLEIAGHELSKRTVLHPGTHTADYGNAAYGQMVGHREAINYLQSLGHAPEQMQEVENPEPDFGN